MRRVATIVLTASVLLQGACVTGDRVRGAVSKLQTGPVSPPTKTISNFSDGLSCMDDLLLDYKMPETTFLIEGLTDNTGKVSSGSRDMLITALAAMSRRSNAIRVVTYDYDTTNAISFMERAQGRQLYARVPKFDIRGSISQYDSRVATDRVNAALSTKTLGVGGDRRISGDVLGVDLSVIRTKDLSVVSAATSSNQVIITDTGGSADGDAVIKKSAIYFNFSVDRAEGPAQAVRNLLDLAAIELIGRLLKVPYWHCLGISADSAAVRREVTDWMLIYDRDDMFISFVRRVLYVKGFYDVNASDPTRAFQQAVRAYQQYAGLEQDGVVDHAFVMALYEDPRRPATPRATVRVYTATEGATLDALVVALIPTSASSAGAIDLVVTLSDSGYLHCFFQGGDGQILRVFPNRFKADNRIAAGEVLHLPGSMPFTLDVEAAMQETLTCFATRTQVAERLPMHVRADDFAPLATSSMAVVREAFLQTASAPVGEAVFHGATDETLSRLNPGKETHHGN